MKKPIQFVEIAKTNKTKHNIISLNKQKENYNFGVYVISS
jgi:hypothetical protein